jgi:hypothetical protein
MSLEKIVEDLHRQGEKSAQIINGQLFIQGRMVPIVADGDQPYFSDCPNGVCNI